MAKRDPLIRRARRNPAVLRRALRNPEKRARLPENMVPRKFRPIVPGSAVTNKQLNRESRAASRVKYGPLVQAQRQQVGEAQAYQRDIGNYYDDYLKQVQAQSQNVHQIGQQAQQAVQNTQAGVTGLAASDLTQMNQAATKDAAARGATPGDLAQMASGAAATRQALVGSFSAQQAATNAANSNYASNRANVVAPGQKLGAVAQAHGRVRQAKEDLAGTKRERGAFRFTYGQERRADEAKNVLAKQALGLDVAKARADVAQGKREVRADIKKTRIDAKSQVAKARADAKKNSPGSQAAVVGAESMAREGAKYGYTYSQWKALGPDGRRRAINQFKSKPGSSGGSSSSGGAAGDKPKRDYLTKGQSASGITQLSSLKDYATQGQDRRGVRSRSQGPADAGPLCGAEKKIKEFVGRAEAPGAAARRRRRRLRRPHLGVHRAAAAACRVQAA